MQKHCWHSCSLTVFLLLFCKSMNTFNVSVWAKHLKPFTSFTKEEICGIYYEMFQFFFFFLLKPKFKECFTFKMNAIIYRSRQTYPAACVTVFIYRESNLNSFLCIAGEVMAYVPLIHGTWELLLPLAPNKRNWCELTECWEHMLGNLELFFRGRLGSSYPSSVCLCLLLWKE